MPTFLREARATFALAVPIILGSVGQMLMGVIDSVMIGRVVTVPLAALVWRDARFDRKVHAATQFIAKLSPRPKSEAQA